MQTEDNNDAHSVTMSALAASTAIVRGVLSSMSAAFWFAPLFRNKHTCLKEEKSYHIIAVNVLCLEVRHEGQTQCVPAWWRGGAGPGPERPAGSRWPHSGVKTHR